MRVYAQIEKRRLSDAGSDLHAQLCWRIVQLCAALDSGEIDLQVPANRGAFKDVLHVYAPAGCELELSRFHRCAADAERGGRIWFTGFLVSDGEQVAQVARALILGRRYAYHETFRVPHRFRGRGIAARSLVQSVQLYDSLDFEHIRTRASFSGSWYWARWGFHFERHEDLDGVRRWAQRIIDACGGGLDVSTFTHPSQFANLGAPTTITFRELIESLPQCEDAFEDIAHQNGIARGDSIPFGRAVMLTGPSWSGCLDLQGPDRLIFDEFAGRRLGSA